MPNTFLAAECLPVARKDSDPFSLATRLFTVRVVRDRFNILNHISPYNFDTKTESINTNFASLIFSDVMDQVANEFIHQYENIVISWSGGLDSTAVVVSFLRNLPENQRDRLTIFGSPSSIQEAPNFYKLLQDLKIKVIISNNFFYDLGMYKCDLITTGCGADSFFASTSLLKAPSLYHMDPYEGIKSMWLINNPSIILTKKDYINIRDLYDFYAKSLGLNISYFCDIAWLFEYGCRFTNGSEKLKMLLGKYPNSNKCIAFFKHSLFSSWAYLNFYKTQKHNPYLNKIDFKLELRKYIYSFDKDEEYFHNKGKADSISKIGFKAEGIYVLTNAGVQFNKIESADWSIPLDMIRGKLYK